jgi:ATP-dependent protease HslVU (ClpYQ) peptidase subunit
MTCIVGIAHKGKTHLAGDSAGVSGLDIVIRKDKKVFTNGDFAMGFTSSFRMGQILQYDFKPPKFEDFDKAKTDDPLMEFMVREFITALRKSFKEHGFSRIDSNEETGGCFLVGTQGRLFQIDADFQVGENLMEYAAVGCGESYALGSLYTTGTHANLKPKWRLEAALEAAAEFSGGVCAPFNFVTS